MTHCNHPVPLSAAQGLIIVPSMVQDSAIIACATCNRSTPARILAESAWLPAEVVEQLSAKSCPECWQPALANWLRDRAVTAGPDGVNPFHDDGRLTPYGVLPSWLQ